MVKAIILAYLASFAGVAHANLRETLQNNLLQNNDGGIRMATTQIKAMLPANYSATRNDACIPTNEREAVGCYYVNSPLHGALPRNADLSGLHNSLLKESKPSIFAPGDKAKMVQDGCVSLNYAPAYTEKSTIISDQDSYSKFVNEEHSVSADLGLTVGQVKVDIGFKYRNSNWKLEDKTVRKVSSVISRRYRFAKLQNTCLKASCDTDADGNKIRCTEAYANQGFVKKWNEWVNNGSSGFDIEAGSGFYFPTVWYIGHAYDFRFNLYSSNMSNTELQNVSSSFKLIVNASAPAATDPTQVGIDVRSAYSKVSKDITVANRSQTGTSQYNAIFDKCNPNVVLKTDSEICDGAFRANMHDWPLPYQIGRMQSITTILPGPLDKRRDYERLVDSTYRPCQKLSKDDKIVFDKKGHPDVKYEVNAIKWLESASNCMTLDDMVNEKQERILKTHNEYCDLGSVQVPEGYIVNMLKMQGEWTERCKQGFADLEVKGPHKQWSPHHEYCAFEIYVQDGYDIKCYD
mmetsp:Transcript_4624/g.8135  ORF Transcript_4624/g.8135 Transcript_4624/m.8135 type:complete len:519 (-) Transcript_4624:13-1569(-)